jgi:hypothetical protein
MYQLFDCVKFLYIVRYIVYIVQSVQHGTDNKCPMFSMTVFNIRTNGFLSSCGFLRERSEVGQIVLNISLNYIKNPVRTAQ